MAETNPTATSDIVKINGTYGTPQNENQDHEHTVTLTYTSGSLTQVDSTMNSVLRKREVLSYTDGVLTSVRVKIYDTDGATVVMDYTDTLNYTAGVLTSVARTVTT